MFEVDFDELVDEKHFENVQKENKAQRQVQFQKK